MLVFEGPLDDIEKSGNGEMYIFVCRTALACAFLDEGFELTCWVSFGTGQT